MAPAPSEMSDVELLNDIAIRARTMWQITWAQHDATYGPVSEDPRWVHSPPLASAVQERHLLTAALDAFDVAAGALASRPSQQALSAIRFLAETEVIVRWLFEVEDPEERLLRSRKLALGSLTRMRQILDKSTHKDSATIESREGVRVMIADLRRFSKEDGLPPLKNPPSRDVLFERYMADLGHEWFTTLSEMGSHPGPAGVLLFSVDPVARKVHVDLSGAKAKRAHFISLAIIHAAHTIDILGVERGWEEWWDRVLYGFIEEAKPSIDESTRRWNAMLGG